MTETRSISIKEKKYALVFVSYIELPLEKQLKFSGGSALTPTERPKKSS